MFEESRKVETLEDCSGVRFGRSDILGGRLLLQSIEIGRRDRQLCAVNIPLQRKFPVLNKISHGAQKGTSDFLVRPLRCLWGASGGTLEATWYLLVTTNRATST